VTRLVGELSGTRRVTEAPRLRLDQVGDGYDTPGEPVMNALTLAARTEGIVLDPIYTGRALAGLVAAVDDGDITPGSRTVFMHTGGLPGLFGHPVTVSYAQGLLQAFG
jgi:L-cysteate sulfo-lyase